MALNPSLLRLITPPDEAFDLHLPAGTGHAVYRTDCADTRKPSELVALPPGGGGDTLGISCAGVSRDAGELAAANEMRASESLEGVEAVVVPVPPSAAPATRLALYTARKGDTLVTIADRFGVSLTQLRRWNKMTGIKVEPGHRLHVAEPATVSRAGRSRHKSATGAGAKEPGTASTKGGGASEGSSAGTKKSGTSSARKQAGEGRKASPGAGQSGPSSGKKAHARKRTAQPKTTASKQK